MEKSIWPCFVLLLVGCGPPAMTRGIDGVQIPEDFLVEIVAQAEPEEGSWVSMAFAPDGSLFVSPQSGRILHFPAGEDVGSLGKPSPIPFPVGQAQGLCWAYDSLYANVVGPADGDGGLHRLFDHDADGQLDEHRHLKSYGPASEHGVHAIVPGPSGGLFMVWGNHVQVPEGFASEGSPVADSWEDTLLPSIPDPRGHAHGIGMPAGTLWRTDEDGEEWELLAGGMRNVYDIAFTSDGSLFGYDSDMEWDIGTPWYRPPRLLHLVAGGDYGWRTGSGKLDPGCPDTLPAVVDTDLSSPTAVLATRELASSKSFDCDLLLGDWAYGRILAVTLVPDGSSFRGSVRVFAEGRPWNITDLVSGPAGNLWVLTGGRGTPSTIYRITHQSRAAAFKPLAPEERSPPEYWKDEVREPSLASGEMLTPSASIWADLGSADRFVRWAARMELKQAPVSEWGAIFTGEWAYQGAKRALLDPLGDAGFLAEAEAKLAIAQSEPEWSLKVWSKLLWGDQWPFQNDISLLELRTAQVIFSRHGDQIPERAIKDFLKRLEFYFGNLEGLAERLALELMVALEAPNLPEMLLDRMASPVPRNSQMHAALLLRLVSKGWDRDTQRRALNWTRDVSNQPGGASLEGFLNAIAADLRRVSGPVEWDKVAAALPPLEPPDWEVGLVERSFVREWTTDAALEESNKFEHLASADRGFRTLSSAGCLACHRFNANGHGLGPDLTGVGRRFDRRTVLEAIIEPGKVVSDQYRDVPMPPGLLNTFGASEIADLLLFLELGAR
ncbi:MAG TPA: hypothetical protein DDW23_04855 [Planctomycetes bacterium]|nr:hypothetical protein [Planctomycetota bacterium]